MGDSVLHSKPAGFGVSEAYASGPVREEEAGTMQEARCRTTPNHEIRNDQLYIFILFISITFFHLTLPPSMM
jgi:hypothetical protein